MLANTLKVAPPYEMTDKEFLDQAEAEIRRSDKWVISEIVAIGKKLTEIKNRVGRGRYGQFIRDRLWFSERSAQQFVQSYEFLKSAQCADFESLHIDGSAVRLLARPSTPNEVRVEALERAAKPQGVSYSEVKRLIAKAEAPLKAKDETEKEASGANATDKSAALAKQTQEQEPGIAWSEEPRRLLSRCMPKLIPDIKAMFCRRNIRHSPPKRPLKNLLHLRSRKSGRTQKTRLIRQ